MTSICKTARFTAAYIEAALWSSVGDCDGTVADDHTIEDLAPEARQAMRDDCRRFIADNEGFIREGAHRDNFKQAGHDFWLTRNGHGAGFWDGDWPEETGEALTKASTGFHEVSLYVGDDGRIYQDR